MIEKLSDYETERALDDAFVPYMIRCAQSGCQRSARSLASIAAGYIRSGEPLPVSLRDFIAGALVSGSENKSVDKALLLKHGRGKNDTALYKKQAIANEVRGLYWTGAAKTITEACEMVSKSGVKWLNGGTASVFPNEARKYYHEIWPGKSERCPKASP